MSAEDPSGGNEDERRPHRKLAFEDADRTFAEVDPDRLTPKLPFDPPKPHWKDVIGDPEPKNHWKDLIGDPKHPQLEEPKTLAEDIPELAPDDLVFPRSLRYPKTFLDPKIGWKDVIGDPEPKNITKDLIGDPKHPKVDIDPDPKAILDPKQVLDPVKMVAYDVRPGFDPGRVFDPGRLGLDPGAAARRPFVLGMPHHAPSAGMMAGSDPRAAAMMRSGAGYAGGAARDPAAVLEATLAQVEVSMRMLKRDLESLDDYYRELRDQYDELAEAEDGGDTDSDDAGDTEEDGE